MYQKTSNKRVQKDLNVSFCQAQEQSLARTKAMLDVRLTYFFACLMFAFSSHLPGVYKWNADGTTFEIHINLQGQLYAITRQNGDTTPLTVTAGCELALFIKYMTMINAAGEFGEACFIVVVCLLLTPRLDLPASFTFATQGRVMLHYGKIGYSPVLSPLFARVVLLTSCL